MHRLTLAALALVCCNSVFGQVSVEDLKAKGRAEDLNDLIIGYNRKTDRTVIVTKPVELLGEAFMLTQRTDLEPMRSLRQLPHMLFVTIGYEGEGEGLQATPDKLTIAFTSNARGWPFLKGDDNLYIVCDGRRMQLRPAPKDDASRPLFTGPIHFERLVFDISRDELKAIIAAKKIEMQLGGTSPRKWKERRIKQVRAILAITAVNP